MNISNVLYLFFVVHLTVVTAQTDFYTAAVVDFAPYFNNSKNPNDTIQHNLNDYVKLIKDAKNQNADIIVFPEDGLTSVHLSTEPYKVVPYSISIPDPELKISPCKAGNWTTLLEKLSCSAKENKIYVVVNLVENVPDNTTEDIILYNTNVVFDRSGAVVARYRKYNLFLEPAFNITKTPELVSFTTDFGVTFGTFICFDILFGSPSVQLLIKNSRITDVVYPAAWFSELPFLSAVSTQAAFSRSYGINLLAAGYNNPSNGNGGSGIYSADGNIAYIAPVVHKSTLIVSKVPKIKTRRSDRVINKANFINYGSQGNNEELHTKSENLANYTTYLVNTTLKDHKLCHYSFCCTFDITFEGKQKPDYYYRLITYNGSRIFGIVENDVQICGLVACLDKQLNSCGSRLHSSSYDNPIEFTNISIKGENFINSDYSVYLPSVTNYNLSTSSVYDYKTTKMGVFKKIEMKNVNPETELLGFGIYTVVGNAGFNNLSLMPLILMCLIMVLIK